MKQISSVARGQRQIMHQLDNLSNLLREGIGERSQAACTRKKNMMAGGGDFIKVPVILTLAIGGLGIFLYRGILTRH